MIVGITGHRDLGSVETTSWTRKQLALAIDLLHITEGLTSLAVGSDQLFAEALRIRGIPFSAIIPSRSYDATFSGSELDRYQKLLSLAAETTVLHFAKPSEEAFFAAGEAIVERSDGIIAVWNGKPARGKGGTADVVRLARSQRKLTLQLNPELREVVQLAN